ncbi:MAG: hypothetical protein E7Z68_10515, partial [Thermoplasmata archaeon]|nr:hypothetical protein [Thermoplasmata archaeon]
MSGHVPINVGTAIPPLWYNRWAACPRPPTAAGNQQIPRARLRSWRRRMGGDGERTVLTLKAKIYPDSEQERAIAACIEGYRRAYNY